MQKLQRKGLVADLWPNIRLIQLSGLFMTTYYSDNSTLMRLIRRSYSWIVTILLFTQYFFLIIYALTESYNPDQRAAYAVTALFFTHSLIRFMFFSMGNKSYYRTLGYWNNPLSHPLFAESDARCRANTVSRMRKLLFFAGGVTIFSTFSWILITLVGPNTKEVHDPETDNGTMFVEIPRLPLGSFYPFDTSVGMAYYFTFCLQVYYIFVSLSISNLLDSLFDSCVLVSSEQLKHLKGIMGPLIELSAALDTPIPNPEALFRVGSAGSKTSLIDANNEEYDENYQNYNNNALSMISGIGGGSGPNGLTKKQEILVRSAIKYWVERHKHIVKYVAVTTDMYGLVLLFHMLVTTFTLTLLAYMATQIRGVNTYAFSTIGYLLYTLGQLYTFCMYGNELIDESSSVMEAAYSCSWYDGSEEAKTFVQIVCQQCQKALAITGAKFFTVSLDLFASVLGAVVTYFMVLIQLG